MRPEHALQYWTVGSVLYKIHEELPHLNVCYVYPEVRGEIKVEHYHDMGEYSEFGRRNAFASECEVLCVNEKDEMYIKTKFGSPLFRFVVDVKKPSS